MSSKKQIVTEIATVLGARNWLLGLAEANGAVSDGAGMFLGTELARILLATST